MDLLILISAGLLGLTTLPVIYRMVVGPTILDRATGLDMLLVFVVMGLGLYTAATGSTFAIIPALALTGTGFIGALALARFVARAEGSEHTDPVAGMSPRTRQAESGAYLAPSKDEAHEPREEEPT